MEGEAEKLPGGVEKLSWDGSFAGRLVSCQEVDKQLMRLVTESGYVFGAGGGGVFVEDSLSCLVSRGVKVQVAGDKS